MIPLRRNGREGERKIERGCEGACEGIKENRCIGIGQNQSCWATAEEMQLRCRRSEVAGRDRVGAAIEHLANVFFHSENWTFQALTRCDWFKLDTPN